MPDVYSKEKFDIAGFSVGIVSKKKILDKKKVRKAILLWLFHQMDYIQTAFL